MRAGWYCVGCEEYKQDDEIDKQHNCPVHLKPCIHREEENFFFRLSNYQKQLEVSTVCDLLYTHVHLSKHKTVSVNQSRILRIQLKQLHLMFLIIW